MASGVVGEAPGRREESVADGAPDGESVAGAFGEPVEPAEQVVGEGGAGRRGGVGGEAVRGEVGESGVGFGVPDGGFDGRVGAVEAVGGGGVEVVAISGGGAVAPVGPELLLRGAGGAGAPDGQAQAAPLAAADPAAGISAAEVSAGLATSRQTMGPRLYGPTWDGLDTAEKRFLVCMLGDSHDSGIADLARRGVEPEAATGLRKRLIDKGLIACSGPGRVAFTHTEARRYARMQSEAEGWRLATDGCPVEPTEAA
ncbi:MAG: hypothetical protein OXG91_01935 [bacterium]|nr:hypothetical protein [bacterium]